MVVTRELPDAVMDRMEALFQTVSNREDRAHSPAELAESVADAAVLVPTVTDTIDAALI